MNAEKGAGRAERKKLKKGISLGYLVGSAALFAAACAVIPAAMTKITGVLYKAAPKAFSDEEDNWGPVIEKKEKGAE